MKRGMHSEWTHAWQRGGGSCGKGRVLGEGKGCAWQRDMCAGETAIEAASTHPTGMHPCFIFSGN